MIRQGSQGAINHITSLKNNTLIMVCCVPISNLHGAKVIETKVRERAWDDERQGGPNKLDPIGRL